MIIRVHVKPNSKDNKIEKISGEEYNINLKEPAEDNRANKEMVNILAKHFNVNFRKIKIKNPTSRDKIVEINS
jgi:uncharacterized protein